MFGKASGEIVLEGWLTFVLAEKGGIEIWSFGLGPEKRATATATSFCPRRAAKGREEGQLLLPLLFVHEGPRRTAKNGNCNFLLSTKGHEGPRRTATATSFCPRRAAKDHGERQLQLPFVREGPRRTAKNGNCNFLLSTKGHEGPRRTATATSFCPRRAAKDHGERQLQLPFVHEGPRRTTENGNCNFLLSAKGCEGPRRTATATSFCPRRAAKDHGERQLQLLFVHGGARGTLWGVAADYGCRT